MENKDFIAYEYTTKVAKASEQARICDIYEAFGWEITSIKSTGIVEEVSISLKRDRKIAHKAELTRLERQAIECYESIKALEKSKTNSASAFAYTFGTASALVFGGGMSLCLTQTDMVAAIAGGVVLGIVGLVMATANYFAYKSLAKKKTQKVLPVIDQKEEQLANLLEQGNDLLNTDIL